MEYELNGILEGLFKRGYNHGVSGGMSEDGEFYAVSECENAILTLIRKREEGVVELLSAVKEWIQWFDYLCAYQHENLDKGLEQACENWSNMYTPDPSPRMDRLKSAFEKMKQLRDI